MTARYIVVGNPIAHSPSPLIHASFAEQVGHPLRYDRLWVEIGRLPEALNQFKKEGGKGANITLPFKLEAFNYVDVCSNRARRAKAVNTIKFKEDGTCLGDNTDGVGMVRDITKNLGWKIGGKRVLMLGAGGAVRGALAPLLAHKPAELVIANRTVAKAAELVAEFSDFGMLFSTRYDAIEGSFGLIINGTSAGLQGEVPPLPKKTITASTCCYDMAYGPTPIAFLQWARACGCRDAADGLGMLVEQAAESFYLWRRVRPKTAPIIAQLRDSLGG